MRSPKYPTLLLVLSLLSGLFFPYSGAAGQSSVEVIVHNIRAVPIPGKAAYTVHVFFSVLNAAGLPIANLTPDNFALTEDTQKMVITGLQSAQSEPMHLVLAMDISGTMLGPGLEASRSAAANFVIRLHSEDAVALVTFNDTVSTVAEFTSNLQAITEEIGQISPTKPGGTCLYDAAYQAVQLAATAPSGRRAVLLLTDGVDENLSGKPCSSHTLEDVIDIANMPGAGVAIYTLGLGSHVDEQILKRIAITTGGAYLFSPTPSDIDTMFTRLLNQMNAQNEITYISKNGPGVHSLTLALDTRVGKNQTLRQFLLPNLPTSISLQYPQEGEFLKGWEKFNAVVLTQGDPISRLVFTVNGMTIGEDFTPPYEYEVDTGQLQPGKSEVSAIALGMDGAELSKVTVSVNIEAPPPTETPVPISTEIAFIEPAVEILPQTAKEPDTQDKPFPLWPVVIGILILAAIGLGYWFWWRTKRGLKSTTEPDFIPQHLQSVHGNGSLSERTAATADIDLAAAGLLDTKLEVVLRVIASQDPAMVGQVLTITKFPSSLGRSAENEVIISRKDHSVSRKHASIEVSGRRIVIRELVSIGDNGELRKPTFGTFVNEAQVMDVPIPLNTEDILRLGSRFTAKIEKVISGSEDIGEKPDVDDTNETTREVPR